MPEDPKTGAGAATATADAEPKAQAVEMDADALLDGDGIPEGKYRISAGKLKEINEVRKAFRAHDLKPEQIPALVARWAELENYVASQAKPKEAEPPKADVDPEQAKQREEAKRIFFELFPEFKDVPQLIEFFRKLGGEQKTAVDVLYLDAHDHVLEQLEGMGVKDLTADVVQDIEDVILKRIQADKAEAARFYYGRTPMRIVTKHLKAVLETFGRSPNGERAKAAQLEAAKRKAATLPPRITGAPPAPHGGTAPHTPRTVREAGEATRTMLRAARSAEE